MKAIEVYAGSDGDLTKRFYAELQKRGPIGEVSVCLFRAQKASARAKVYRGGNSHGSYKRMAYDKKGWSLETLCKVLVEHGSALGITFGWKQDEAQDFAEWVFYCELGEYGQVSFHSPTRYTGPDYPGDWDRTHRSAERIIQFCDWVMTTMDSEEGPLLFDPAQLDDSEHAGAAQQQTAQHDTGNSAVAHREEPNGSDQRGSYPEM